ncbi:unnamed protein product [Euphydryas editha]|uniref:Copper homeostasis protein cutC homolog n=1 Tax=Euphydryas editha TaxID=104508 RepID=A0AAU9U8E1_EUPED|nr:unnamed protein product [Euphydryas editha]
MAGIPKNPRYKCYFGCEEEGPLHHFPKPDNDSERFNVWKRVLERETQEKENTYIYNQLRLCNKHFENYFISPSNRLTRNAVPTLYLKDDTSACKQSVDVTPSISAELKRKLKTGTKLEVCIDTLESALNAVKGGADELEVCSSLAEGGLTPSPGLVKEIIKIKPKINVMIRCRGGSDFCYTDSEMKTMLSDIEFYKEFGIDRFVFGALTDAQEIDKINCTKVIEKAHPIPVTFHRAFDMCREPKTAIEDIILLGFNRILTSGQKICAADDMALHLLKFLLTNYGDKIEIMPGAGVNLDNANVFVESGFNIIHSSCKKLKLLVDFNSDLKMGNNVMYVTDQCTVKTLKGIIESNS